MGPINGDIDSLASQMMAWRVESSTPAVRVSRGVQWLFDHALYRVGLRGATTISKLACRPFTNETAVVANARGARFAFPAWDSYYGHYLFGGVAYEPEITLLLAAHSTNQTASFLDCGANYGYWTVIAAGALNGRVVAVELNPTTIEWLRTNAARLGPRVASVNAAIWDTDGEAMSISRVGPNQSHSAELSTSDSEVRSRSIDSLVSELGLVPCDLLVKIDCEGAEIRALAGAAQTAARGACFVLEDHGSDPECAVSRRLFELDWNVAVFDDARRRWHRVFDVAEVKAIKTDPVRGYNVVAWSGKLQPPLEAAFG